MTKKKKVYIFDGDVIFNCNINTKINIKAKNICACDIKALDINANNIEASDIIANDIYAQDIKALDINAQDIEANDIIANDIIANDIIANNISYYAICIAYDSFKCKKIEGRYKNPIHKCLCNDIEFINDEE